jgi:DNA-binding SARP family transcriptional activator
MAGPHAVWNELAAPAVEIRVLGELEVLVGGVPAGDGLRRSRVRTLLELLVVAGPIRRERLADMMWPDLDPAAAAANLRVTLTRLRTLFGTNRLTPRSVIEADSQRVSLAALGVRIDLAEFDSDLAVADAAERGGDTPAAAAALERACRLWRGEPLPDLDGVDGVAAEVEYVRRRVTAAALRLATLLADARRFDAAAHWAERVRDAAPYDERAHRLAIVAHIDNADRAAARHAARVTQELLADLAVEPEQTTRALLRQVTASQLV